MAYKHSKRFRQALALVESDHEYPVAEAITTLLSMPPAGFDETIEVAARLGVDPRHADQVVRGTVVLPHGLGKSVRVLVIARGPKATEAQEAEADRSAPRMWSRRSTAAGWISTSASPPPT
jgi:large subunit ribosomal protein L1